MLIFDPGFYVGKLAGSYVHLRSYSSRCNYLLGLQALQEVLYGYILGFEAIRESFREERNSFKLDLKVNDLVQIELFSFPNAPHRPSHPEAAGLRHLTFAVEDVGLTKRILEDKGIALGPSVKIHTKVESLPFLPTLRDYLLSSMRPKFATISLGSSDSNISSFSFF